MCKEKGRRRGRARRREEGWAEDEEEDQLVRCGYFSFTRPEPDPAIPVSCNPLELFSSTTLIGLIVTKMNKFAKLCLESEGKQSTWSSTEEELPRLLHPNGAQSQA